MTYTLIFDAISGVAFAIGAYSSLPILMEGEYECAREQWDSPGAWKFSDGQIVPVETVVDVK